MSLDKNQIAAECFIPDLKGWTKAASTSLHAFLQRQDVL